MGLEATYEESKQLRLRHLHRGGGRLEATYEESKPYIAHRHHAPIAGLEATYEATYEESKQPLGAVQ